MKKPAAVNQSVIRTSVPEPSEDFQYRVEQMIDSLPRKEKNWRKQKGSVGLVLAMVLLLIAVGAMAAAMLTARQVVEQEAVPLARNNDTQSINERFDSEELQRIVTLAEENGIVLSERLITVMESGEGYWEEEVIMSLAKSQFGPYPAQWTIKEQYWLEETLVAIGFKASNACLIPGENDLTYEEAYALAKHYIASQGWLEDTSILDDRKRYDLWRTYQLCTNGEGEKTGGPCWQFDFETNDMNQSTYHVRMDQSGGMIEITRDEGTENAELASQIIAQFKRVYGSYSDWTWETWAELGKQIKDRVPDTSAAWIFQNAGYICPPDGAISDEEAKKIAVQAVGLDDTKAVSMVCCMDGETSIWKVTTHTDHPRDMGSGMHTAIWNVEISADTGEVREKREFIVGGGVDPLTLYVPYTTFENIPPMPESPNG